ncbi:MAG: UDPGP type 1 family protein [Lentisphaerae bacterium]|nr:UDPGP type 1 family protein [Lentisphaerota bacterium]
MAEISAELIARITAAGQQHVLRFFDELSYDDQENLKSQLEAVNWESLPALAAEYVVKRPETAIPDDLAPAGYFRISDAGMAKRYAEADARGIELLKQGKICCLTVAGGQGTRLGFDAPKGTYPIGPVSNRTLFEYFASSILRLSEKYNCSIPWYIMTSPINRAATENFFKAHNFFGLAEKDLFFFTQGTMPAFGLDGKLLMSSKSSLALSPDGHGGTLLALRRSGALDKMKQDGTEIVSYFQVDNPLVPVVSPRFAGLLALENAEVGAIVLSKTGPFEKLGNFCMSCGRTMIIEYSDLPAELAEKRNADGSLQYSAGSPAIHVFSRNYIERLTAGNSLQLPWHRADKKIASINDAGELCTPADNNGVKLESFIFDALPLAEKVILFEGDRNELFAPTKNLTGVDSVESCRRMISDRNARRLAACGVDIPRNADGSCNAEIEIDPRLVCDDADAAALVAATGLKAILPGQKVAL